MVEVDETYVSGKKRGKGRSYTGNKTPVVSLIEQKGRVRSHVVQKVTGKTLDVIYPRPLVSVLTSAILQFSKVHKSV